MKKWAAIFTVLLVAGIYLVWPKASVKAPVVMSVQVDEAKGTMEISYITSKRDDTYLLEVAVEGEERYSIEVAGAEEEGTRKSDKLLDQNGYQLREDTIVLTDEELEYFQDFPGHAPLVTLSYKDYEPIKTILILLKDGETAEGVVDEYQLNYTFTAPEEMSISSIGHYDSVATISYSQNGKELKLPVELEQGEKIDLSFWDPYNLGSNDNLLLEIETTDGKYYRKHIATPMEIPEGYLKQLAAVNR
ncbi:hypothetical protein [Planococcus halotolerans]|uniref:Uncharacterized protein n=1 Tax=Planococcus halotolerans TaxID=2233542 RepID=A0A365L7Q4_9BACL|nr:hypothetical protein [Planococcus halotolerans]RAZ81277.1 hypothetical protein DP120_03040 [Planococcus halotolerans]